MTSRHTIDRYVKEGSLDGCLYCNNAKQRRWMVSANIALQRAINDHSKQTCTSCRPSKKSRIHL